MLWFQKITQMVLLSIVGISIAHGASWNMNKVHFQFAADHVWLFYECGGQGYFNHEVRDKRQENDQRLTFAWVTHSTLIGIRYCDGFGHSLNTGNLKSSTEFRSINTGNQLKIFFQTSHESELIRIKTYSGRPVSQPVPAKWSKMEVLKDDKRRNIMAEKFSVSSYGNSFITTFIKNKSLYIRSENGKIKKLSDLGEVSTNSFLSTATTVNKSGTFLSVLIKAQSQHGEWKPHLIQIDLSSLKENKLDSKVNVLDKMTTMTSPSLISELNGSLFLQYVQSGKRYRAEVNQNNLQLDSNHHHNNFTSPFSTKESLAFSSFQAPFNCKLNESCSLINFTYSKSANWTKSISSLFHLSYGGKVVIEPLYTVPVEQEKMELVGIIEGPPPVPLENILASFEALPSQFVINAARGLSKSIKTNINQVLTMTQTQSQKLSNTQVHSMSMKGSIPLVAPINLSGMAAVKNQLVTTNEETRTSIIKKAFSNEIQHANDVDNKLYMKPVGKLIFLKYDLTGYQYKFLDKNDKPVENGPALFSLGKTNIRPVIRQYDIIAKKVNPEKYLNHIEVGNLHSYQNFHRRRNLLKRATQLAPGHNYLAFSFNNALDLASEVNIKTSKTVTTSNTDSLKAEGSVGAGFGDIFGASITMSNETERTISVANSSEKGMGISVNMGFVVPTENPSVKFYDFEVYYLEPSKENFKELMVELNDTAQVSRWNRKMLDSIREGSQPWKVTYSVSNIMENENLPIDNKDDFFGDGAILSQEERDKIHPKTYFGLLERCQDYQYASRYPKACLKVDSFIKKQKGF